MTYSEGKEPIHEVRSKDNGVRRAALETLVHFDSDKATDTLARIAEGSLVAQGFKALFYTPEERGIALGALEYRESKLVLATLARIAAAWPQPYGQKYTTKEQRFAEKALSYKLKRIKENEAEDVDPTDSLKDVVENLIRIFHRSRDLTGQLNVIRLLGHSGSSEALEFLERTTTPIVKTRSEKQYEGDYYSNQIYTREVIYEEHVFPVPNPLRNVLQYRVETWDGIVQQPIDDSNILRWRKYANQVISGAKSNLRRISLLGAFSFADCSG